MDFVEYMTVTLLLLLRVQSQRIAAFLDIHIHDAPRLHHGFVQSSISEAIVSRQHVTVGALSGLFRSCQRVRVLEN